MSDGIITPSSGNVFADLGLPDAERLLGSADRLMNMLEALRLSYAALANVEDAGVTWDDRCCPSCRMESYDAEKGIGPRHDADCELARALAAIEALLPDVKERGA